MDVGDQFGDAEGAQGGKGDFEGGAAGDFDERLGASVGEGAKASAEAGGKNHGFHCGDSIKSARLSDGVGVKSRRLLQRQKRREISLCASRPARGSEPGGKNGGLLRSK